MAPPLPPLVVVDGAEEDAADDDDDEEDEDDWPLVPAGFESVAEPMRALLLPEAAEANRREDSDCDVLSSTACEAEGTNDDMRCKMLPFACNEEDADADADEDADEEAAANGLLFCARTLPPKSANGSASSKCSSSGSSNLTWWR